MKRERCLEGRTVPILAEWMQGRPLPPPSKVADKVLGMTMPVFPTRILKTS